MHGALFTVPNQLFWFGLANMSLYFIYTGKFEIFECERCSPDEQWPWESMQPEVWQNFL